MTASREELIKQIDAANALIRQKIANQYTPSGEKETQIGKFRKEIFNRILDRADQFYQETRQAFFSEMRGDKLNKEHIEDVLDQLGKEFNNETGKQPAYLRTAVENFLQTGNYGAYVSVGDIIIDGKPNPDKTDLANEAVFICSLTIYGYLLRQKCCLELMSQLEKMNQITVNENYTKDAFVMTEGLERGINKINTNVTQDLNTECKSFDALLIGLMDRLRMASNSTPLTDSSEKNNTPLADLIGKVKSELFNGRQSRLPTLAEVNTILENAKIAAASGNEDELLKLQHRVKALQVLRKEIYKSLRAALEEYESESNKKLKNVKQFSEEFNEYASSSTVVYQVIDILTIAEKMSHQHADKNDYDTLRSNIERLATACADLDVTGSGIGSGMGITNGWKQSGIDIQNELSKLIAQLVGFNAQFTDEKKRDKANKLYQAFKKFNKAYVYQLDAIEGFETALERIHVEWPGNLQDDLKSLSPDWRAISDEVMGLKASGWQSFVRRHRLKVALSSIALATAVVLASVFIFSLAWPLVVAAAVTSLVAGIVIAATASFVSDQCCRIPPSLPDVATVNEAEQIIVCSSTMSIVKSMRSDDDIELGNLGNAFDEMKALDPTIGKPSTTVSGTNPFARDEDKTSEATAGIRSYNPFSSLTS